MAVHFVKGKPKTSGKRRKPAPVVQYPPGYFTKGISEWLKGWTPTSWGPSTAAYSEAATRNAEMGSAFGGKITLDLPKTPHGNRKPGRM